MDELKVNGDICFGPLCARSFPGQTGFDKYYIDRTVKQVVKKTGEGEDDYILVDKEVITRRDIRKAINSQAADVGIESFVRQYQLEYGVDPLAEPGPSTDDIFKAPIQDFSGMPNNLADAIMLGENSRKAFASLPKELRGKMDYEEFVTSFTNEMFEKFMDKMKPQEEVKGE